MKKLLAPLALSLITFIALIAPAGAATNDTYRARQWGLDKIKAEAAWATSTGLGSVIAVVDSGADMGHPDLQANLIAGRDFVGKDNDPQDENGHGTHVSGIVAAVTNNGIGVAGTAPDAKVLVVRALDADGSGSTDDIAAAIRYATDNGAHVINLSLGVMSGLDKIAEIIGALDAVNEAIDYAWENGVVIVAAAGNDSFPLCSEPSGHPKVLCVGATDQNDTRSFYSNSDATMTSKYLVAPGGSGLSCAGDIFSTYLRSQESFCSPEAGYEAIAGTSMATPFVSGVAGLLVAKGDTNQQVVDCIIATVDDLGPPGRDPIYGYGRLNAERAVATC